MKEILADSDLLCSGMESLDDALCCFDMMISFEGRNLSAATYILLRYAEDIIVREKESDDEC